MLSIKHVVSLFIFLSGVWFLFSGYTKPLLLLLGVVSVALTVFLALRMEVLDNESHPVELTPSLLIYWAWLILEIVKSNLAVTRHILSPDSGISPRLVRLPMGQRTDIGRAIYANSITLTPGTVSLNVGEDVVEVHALTRELAGDLESGGMSARIPDPGGRA